MPPAIPRHRPRIAVRALLLLALTAVAVPPAGAGVLLDPQPAPEWVVSDWINGDPGPLSGLRGKVVLIEFFQLWCPGCNGFSIPLFRRWNRIYGQRDDVRIVSIHSVFEGHDVQTPERLRAFVADKGITHPVGIDAYPRGSRTTPITMHRFETGGTPHVVIVDQEGKLRFSHFGAFDPAVVESFINRLLQEGGSEIDSLESDGPPARDTRLSGNYRLTLEQTSKSCGPAGRRELQLDLEVLPDRVEARFAEGFLDLRKVGAAYDPANGSFRTSARRRTVENGVGVTLELELHGGFKLRSEPPALIFEFALDKRGDVPGLDCRIEGRGEALRMRER